MVQSMHKHIQWSKGAHSEMSKLNCARPADLTFAIQMNLYIDFFTGSALGEWHTTSLQERLR